MVRYTGPQYPMAQAFEQEKAKLYEARRLQTSLSPQRGPRLSNLSLERFRTSIKDQDRRAAADIAFCVAAYANGMTEGNPGTILEHPATKIRSQRNAKDKPETPRGRRLATAPSDRIFHTFQSRGFPF